jgi:hypothetical protein
MITAMARLTRAGMRYVTTCCSALAQKPAQESQDASQELRQALTMALTALLIIVMRRMMLLLILLIIVCALTVCGAMALSLVMQA